jgi:hypothetical protein
MEMNCCYFPDLFPLLSAWYAFYRDVVARVSPGRTIEPDLANIRDTGESRADMSSWAN